MTHDTRPLIACEDPEKEADEKTQFTCYGWRMDPRTWISWRSSNSNRNLWRAACSIAFMWQMSRYFVYAKSSIPLCFMGVCWTVKLLAECWGQDTPTWVAPNNVLMFILLFFGLGGFIKQVAYCTRVRDIDFAYQEVVAVTCFLFGYIYSFAYELHRFWWKAQPENKGRLHTTGLAAYCIHPNYFGDLFTYTGWALATGTLCALSVPACMPWAFDIFVLANSDGYLAQKYPEEFPEYAEKTPTLIPFCRSKLLLHILGWSGFFASSFLAKSCTAACGSS